MTLHVFFRDYNSALFAEVRALCGVDDADYAAAFEAPPTNERFSEGRSGAFLYFSHGHEYIVKTTTKREAMTLMKLMPDYVSELRARPDSLLVRYPARTRSGSTAASSTSS